MKFTNISLSGLHSKVSAEAHRVMMVRNADYIGKSGDPFRNLRRHGLQGIVVRLSDKLARLESVAEGQLLKSEGARDTVIDIINYAILFEAMRLEEGGDDGKEPSAV
jgi:hypothetical protein